MNELPPQILDWITLISFKKHIDQPINQRLSNNKL